ncbi:mucin-desulfating sulfatase [Lentisphaera araneosa HTCC2155]|uniref:Mucin-desulfating sulfatase n=1 Tax=Lentisphaera araneosa HTCC2155 TaxID=313628 RepID=A6DHY1_9BACT|nr:sulfatase [Lentisphaera araneosa]EDM28635.1 mucin-desulfating sulfatase [Lentisphaera araneosa HTCC2155]
MKRIFSLLVLAFLINTKADDRPNIIMLLTDDQRYDTLGCMGNDQVKTPHIDKLSERGVTFDSHYTNTPICLGSRASTMTGMYEYTNGCNFSHGFLSQELWDEMSYPVILRNNGYFTGFIGKFGFPVNAKNYHEYENLPIDSFDRWYGWTGQGYFDTSKNKYMVKFAKEYPHVTLATAEAACEFIDEAQKQDKPFCLSLSFKASHKPFSPDPAYDDVYKDTVWKKRANYDEGGARKLPPQAKLGRQYLTIDDFAPEKYQESMRKYNQLIYGIDQAVGKIVEKLDQTGLSKNTVIIYATDNGYSCGSHGFGGKVLPYEGPARGPMIIMDPRSDQTGKRSKGVSGNVDIHPTICDLAGIAIPAKVDGKSLLPVLKDSEIRVRKAMPVFNFWGSAATHEMTMVTEDYKYIYWYFEGDGMVAAEELYHRHKDSAEMNNLVNNPEMALKLEEMRQLFDAQVQHIRDHAMADRSYTEYGKLLDRTLAWEEKQKHVQKSFMKSYIQMKDIVENGQTKKPKKEKSAKENKAKVGKERVRKAKDSREPRKAKESA